MSIHPHKKYLKAKRIKTHWTVEVFTNSNDCIRLHPLIKIPNVWSTQGTQSLRSTFKQKKRTAEYSWTYTTKKRSLWPKTDLNDLHFTPNIRLHVNNLIQEGYINVPNFVLLPTYAEGCCKSTIYNLTLLFFSFLQFLDFLVFQGAKTRPNGPSKKCHSQHATCLLHRGLI